MGHTFKNSLLTRCSIVQSSQNTTVDVNPSSCDNDTSRALLSECYQCLGKFSDLSVHSDLQSH